MTVKKTNDNVRQLFKAVPKKSDLSMLWATLVGVGVHVILIFGVSFTTGKSPSEMAKEVAIALTKNTEINENAKFIADGSQQGSGESEEVVRQSSSEISPITSDDIEETRDLINQEKKIRQREYHESYLHTILSYKEIEKKDDNEDDNNEEDETEQKELIRQQIATLEAQLSQNTQDLTTITKVETIDMNSTTYDETSRYLDNFRQHVERTANHYYPEKALAQNLKGDVRLMIIINFDGSVKAIRLLEGSGSRILDEAAKQSVRQSAPYGDLNEYMKTKDIQELRIIRTWRYTGND